MKVEKSFKCLGTDIYLVVIIKDRKEEVLALRDLNDAVIVFNEYHKKFSRFDLNSELSKINASLGEFDVVSNDFLGLCEIALEFYEKTERVFDPRIYENLHEIGYSGDFPKINVSERKVLIEKGFFENDLREDLIIKNNQVCFEKRMDLTGIAKGFIVDLVSKKLFQKGWRNFMVDAGGDIFASGKNDRGEKWNIEIEGFPREKLQLVLSDEAIATSGITKRKWKIGEKQFHHLINPKKPDTFSFELKTVTVIAESAIEADAWAKVMFLLGKEKGVELSEEKRIKSIFLDYRGNIFHSSYTKLNFYKK